MARGDWTVAHRSRRAGPLGWLAVAAGACSGPPPAPPPPAEAAIIVGVQSEPLIGAIDKLQLVTTLGGATNTSETMAAGDLPHEVRIGAPDGRPGVEVGVQIQGFLTAAGPSPLLVRTAETVFVAGQTKLLRVLLQGQCLLGLPGGPPGAPTCVAPRTCIAGVCEDDHVNAASLEAYVPGWAYDTPDICKPLHAGPPAIQVGTGQTDYLPLAAGETIQAELGPQGGHHVWVAVRQQNLKATGSTTTITSVQPTTGRAGPRTAFVFTFSPDQGGFCKLSGLRYQLDSDGSDYRLFLGQRLDITVTIADPAGATGTGIAHVNIAPSLVCPSGATDGGC